MKDKRFIAAHPEDNFNRLMIDSFNTIWIKRADIKRFVQVKDGLGKYKWILYLSDGTIYHTTDVLFPKRIREFLHRTQIVRLALA